MRLILQRFSAESSAETQATEGTCPVCPPTPESKGGACASITYPASFVDVLGPCMSSPFNANCATIKDGAATATPDCPVAPGSMATATVARGGFYALILLDCACDGAAKSPRGIAYTIEIVEKNPDSYAPCGEQPVPIVLMCCAALYVIMLVAWVLEMRRNLEHCHRVHLLMAALVLCKALAVIFNAAKDARFASDGQVFSGWAVPFYLFYMARGFLLFVVILLVGTGWSVLKPFLSPRDHFVLMCVLPAQVLFNLAYIVVDESVVGSPMWNTWRNVFKAVDLVCCVAVVFPIFWSINALKKAAETDGKARRSLAHLRDFRTFYIVVVVYIYYTRIAVTIIEASLPYTYTWVAVLLHEIGTMSLYVWSGTRFRPKSASEYDIVDAAEELEDIPERVVRELTAPDPANEARDGNAVVLSGVQGHVSAGTTDMKKKSGGTGE